MDKINMRFFNDGSKKLAVGILKPMLLLALFSVATPLFQACKQKEVPVNRVQKIKVVKVKTADLPLYSYYVGQVYGEKDIPIRARVEGFLESINFKEGKAVKKGQLLYTIDSQPFVAELNARKSELAEKQTMLAKALSDLNRIKPLAEAKAMSESDLDAAQAQYDAALAALDAAKAGVDYANINLGYTRIKSPINGIIGITEAKVGEFVGREPNPVILNVVSKTDKILVKFYITEKEYLLYARNIGNAETKDSKSDNLELLLSDGSLYNHKGYLDAIDAKVDPNTGSILVQAIFPNPEGLLKPGMYCKVKLEYKKTKNSLIVPSRCLSELQGHYFVYLVNDSNKVETRQLETGETIGDMTIVNKGLKAGDMVVLEGLQKVAPDALIKPEVVDFKSSND